ncbi:hypothetical protein A1O1_01188 [Capronia coronata CBS 617.96]|uniref:Uncharacterized protein n=1 Tax=Capronia coronata CBS 617.96 TaxID=1182541 RepID=W9YT33_9EURO|nr:uncharacterized protein A1O1_01188 [Capronia coronata CBS 617.96]EXJ96062.1 hypothetical protein A1O1_01188 [Capronia coronata CBS 617.96]
MGRHAHITRLALGRSPFEAPLQDDSGNFILGPNVQHDTARNYIQHFDLRGHPQNLASEASRRRLIRAENDALSTVGVVVRKAKMNRSPWQTMSEKQKHMLLLEENVAGANWGLIVDLVQKISTRWIVCFRRRLLTYRSYLGLSMPEIIMAEWRSSGPWAFLFSGLPLAAVTSVSQALRDTLLEDERVSNLSHPSSRLHWSDLVRLIRCHSLRIVWYAAEYPLHAFAVLQSLHLVPADATPPLSSLIPFTALSPIQLPKPWPEASLLSIASYAVKAASHPFVLAYILDQVAKHIFTRVYLVARQFMVKPDRPDRLSLQSAKDGLNISPDATIPDMGMDRQEDRGSWRIEGVTEIVRTLFPAVFWFWDKVLQTQRTPLTVELSPDIEEELMHRSIVHYRDLLRQDREVDVQFRRAPRTLRIMAIRSAFGDYNLDPDHAMVDIFELAEEMNFHVPSDASTATPEPLEPSPMMEDEAPLRSEDDPVNHAAAEGTSDPVEAVPEPSHHTDVPGAPPSLTDNHDGSANGALESGTENAVQGEPSPRPAVPLETPRSPVPSNAGSNPPPSDHVTGPDIAIPESEAASSPAPSSPVLGISRAATLPNTIPRPVRRPTDIDEDDRPIREDFFYRRHESRKPRHVDEPMYRVTLLSNHPAETLAQIGASIVESTMLLPFEMLFLRSLARSFLMNRWADLQVSGPPRPLADVWPLGSWFGVRSLDGSQRLHFFVNLSMTLGIQALMNIAVWSASAHFTLWRGSRYGWGKI